MKQRRIPNTELDVSTLCCGTGSFGTGSARGDIADRLIGDFIEAGGNFFDTAHCYGFWAPDGLGASERELGAALRRLGVRDRVVIATKGGHPDGGPDYRRPDDFLAESVLRCDIENSLYRLGVGTIDLYYLHRDDGKTPVGEVIDRLNREVRRGTIRFLGASNWSVERIDAANAYATQRGLQGFVISQVQWGLASPNWMDEVRDAPDPTHRCVDEKELAFHAATGIPVAAFSATESGYFADNPGADALYDNPASRARRVRAGQLAAERGATATQIALAYLLHERIPVIPVFGTTSREHLREITGAADVTLAHEQVAWLRGG
jgi:aryl-alcohol dehydrogenase-like predicted oxidoreductase